eukprot:TRINITY_DN540_c0_g1_i3.p1 TRINITY_DN540_c0_g1~~TRINITY_DN540_c0_g1_i3.p1  ORF type:complete len:414 (-),score=32.60 TRINITY_DN540_c0_g1_i3:79-1320(-)
MSSRPVTCGGRDGTGCASVNGRSCWVTASRLEENKSDLDWVTDGKTCVKCGHHISDHYDPVSEGSTQDGSLAELNEKMKTVLTVVQDLSQDVKSSSGENGTRESSVGMSSGRDTATGMTLPETWQGVLRFDTVDIQDLFTDLQSNFLATPWTPVMAYDWVSHSDDGGIMLNEKQQMPYCQTWLQDIVKQQFGQPSLNVIAKEVKLTYRMILHPDIASKYNVQRGSKRVSGFSDILFSYALKDIEATTFLDQVRALIEVKTVSALETDFNRCLDQAKGQLIRMHAPDVAASGSWRSPVVALTDFVHKWVFLWASSEQTVSVLPIPDLQLGLQFLSLVIGKDGLQGPLKSATQLSPAIFDQRFFYRCPPDVANLEDFDEAFDDLTVPPPSGQPLKVKRQPLKVLDPNLLRSHHKV